MTAQTNDRFSFRDKEYGLSGIENPGEFLNIHELGFATISTNTACWRGYVAAFAVDVENHIVLRNLSVNHSIEAIANNRGVDVPKINGKNPKISQEEIEKTIEDRYRALEEFSVEHPNCSRYHVLGGINLYYSDVDLPLPYTGGILLTNDFIRDRYVHMGFQSPVSYNTVIELRFEEGRLVKETDLSELMKSMRDSEGNTSLPDAHDLASTMKWISEQFDLSYGKLLSDAVMDVM